MLALTDDAALARLVIAAAQRRDEMRAVIESEWPELVYKLPPKETRLENAVRPPPRSNCSHVAHVRITDCRAAGAPLARDESLESSAYAS